MPIANSERSIQLSQSLLADNAPALQSTIQQVTEAQQVLHGAGIQETAEEEAVPVTSLSEARSLLSGVSEALPAFRQYLDDYLEGFDSKNAEAVTEAFGALATKEAVRIPSQAESDVGLILRKLRDIRATAGHLLKSVGNRDRTRKMALNETLILLGINVLLSGKDHFYTKEVCQETGDTFKDVSRILNRLVDEGIFIKHPEKKPNGWQFMKYQPTESGSSILSELPALSSRPLQDVRSDIAHILQQKGQRDRPLGVSIDEVMLLYGISQLAQDQEQLYGLQLADFTGYSTSSISKIASRFEQDGVLITYMEADSHAEVGGRKPRRLFKLTPFGQQVLDLLQ